ncbi:MAG: hypothetical protein Q8R00_01805 [Candidatus Nanoarchaeia archaeon]|nr:hypothetical protein [Candidatus Nanoarchaeia archaeon]
MTSLKVYELERGGMIVYNPLEKEVLYATPLNLNSETPKQRLVAFDGKEIQVGSEVMLPAEGSSDFILDTYKVIGIKSISQNAFKRIKGSYEKQLESRDFQISLLNKETEAKIKALEEERKIMINQIPKPDLEWYLKGAVE